MGFWKKKKAKPVMKTFLQAINHEMAIEDKKIENYIRLKSKLPKFLTAYKQYFDNYVHVNGDAIRIQFKKDFKWNDDFPDGFFALADKLGLNIEPVCHNGYSDTSKSFNVRAKHR